MPDLGVIKVVFGWLNRESPNMCHSRHFLKLFLSKLAQWARIAFFAHSLKNVKSMVVMGLKGFTTTADH